MWEWYTGILIWKTQNPWTSLRGQMYDWFLDVNASLYGTRKGCEPLHAQYNPVSRQVEIVNSALGSHLLRLQARLYHAGGELLWEKEEASVAIRANEVRRLFHIPEPEGVSGVYFLKLTLWEKNESLPSNIYWLTTLDKDYTSLAQLPRTKPAVRATLRRTGKDDYTGSVHLRADEGRISFFNRVKVFDKSTGKRILPVHYSDNYVTLTPGDEQEISLRFASPVPEEQIEIVIDSWTAERIICPLVP